MSEPGSASYGIEVANKGQIRFQRKGPSACKITLTISYEVPDALAPFANVSGTRKGGESACTWLAASMDVDGATVSSQLLCVACDHQHQDTRVL